MTKTNINTTQINNNIKKINNWPEYNKALVNRYNIQLWLHESLLGILSESKPKKSKPKRIKHHIGHPIIYPDALIELMATFMQLFLLWLTLGDQKSYRH